MREAIAFGLAALLTVSPCFAQAEIDRTPKVSMNFGFPKKLLRPGDVSAVNMADSGRADSLIKAGNMYLSLQDAIALALENSLDLEIQRYGLEMVKTDTLRAIGGGTPRGVSLSVGEAPAGIGGPAGNTLINQAASGTLTQSTVSTAVTDTQLIAESQYSLALTGTQAYSSGPVVPSFDPLLTASVLTQHVSTPAASFLQSQASGVSGSASYIQGFSSGATVSPFFTSSHTAQTALGQVIRPYDLSSLGVTFTQPLMRGFGREMNRRFIRIAKNSERVGDYVFEQQIVSTVAGVIRLYDDLVALNEDYRVKYQTYNTARRLFEDNAAKVQEGTLAPIEAVRAQAQLASARQDVVSSEALVRQQELILKTVILRNWADDPIVHDARVVPTDPLQLDPLPVESVQQIVTRALERRPEVQAAKLQVANAEISLEGTRNSLRPQFDLVGTIQNGGISGELNPGATLSGNGVNGNYLTTIDQILKRDYPSATIGLNMSLPVKNRIAQSDVVRDEMQLRQQQIRVKQLENQIRAEVEDTLISLKRTWEAYQAAVDTATLQQQSLDIEQAKFDVGLSTNFLVIQYQGYLAQARSTEVAALDAYVKARAQFERAAGLTLEAHNISVQEALKGQISRRPAVLPATPQALPVVPPALVIPPPVAPPVVPQPAAR